jgi:hypothetical protein
MLGLYLLGVLTRVPQRSALSGFFAGLAAVTALWAATPVWWPWYAAIGASTTFLFGRLFDMVSADSPAPGIQSDKSVPHENL